MEPPSRREAASLSCVDLHAARVNETTIAARCPVELNPDLALRTYLRGIDDHAIVPELPTVALRPTHWTVWC
jgi:hypothetical protein